MVILDHDSPNTIREIWVHDSLQLAAVSFLFYDHAVTLGQEVEYIWQKPKNRSTFWFLMNRYLAFLGNITVTILGLTTLSPQSCQRYSFFRQTLLIVNQVIVCILLTLRIYALYERSVRLLMFLGGCAAVLIGVSLWTLFGQKSAPSLKASGCHIGFSKATAIRLAISWEALFIYDSLIFSLTVLRTWRVRRDYVITGINIPIISLILRDGAVYYAVMVLCNLANILTYYLAGPFLRGGLSSFSSSISVTMMSRLMLNLHQTAALGIYSTSRPDGDTLDEWSGTLDIVNTASMVYGLQNFDIPLLQTPSHPESDLMLPTQ